MPKRYPGEERALLLCVSAGGHPARQGGTPGIARTRKTHRRHAPVAARSRQATNRPARPAYGPDPTASESSGRAMPVSHTQDRPDSASSPADGPSSTPAAGHPACAPSIARHNRGEAAFPAAHVGTGWRGANPCSQPTALPSKRRHTLQPCARPERPDTRPREALE